MSTGACGHLIWCIPSKLPCLLVATEFDWTHSLHILGRGFVQYLKDSTIKCILRVYLSKGGEMFVRPSIRPSTNFVGEHCRHILGLLRLDLGHFWLFPVFWAWIWATLVLFGGFWAYFGIILTYMYFGGSWPGFGPIRGILRLEIWANLGIESSHLMSSWGVLSLD